MGGFVGKGLKKNVIFDILNNKKIRLSPKSNLQFLSTEETSRIISKVLEMNFNNEIFNLTGVGQISVEEIVNLSGKKAEFSDNLEYVNSNINLNKILKLFQFSSSEKTIKSFFNNQNK